MKIASFMAVGVFVLTLFLSGSVARADVKIGDAAPAFSKLPGVDGKAHDLAEYKNDLVVVVFTCNHCPVAQAYYDRLIDLQKKYQDKGVQVVAINVNNIPEDKLDKMIVRAKEKKFNFPYLYDETQKIGHDYGAKVTPHVFVLNKDRKVVYMGAVDDNQNAAKVKAAYLADALDALVQGKEPPKDATKQFGCSIKYEEKK